MTGGVSNMQQEEDYRKEEEERNKLESNALNSKQIDGLQLESLNEYNKMQTENSLALKSSITETKKTLNIVEKQALKQPSENQEEEGSSIDYGNTQDVTYETATTSTKGEMLGSCTGYSQTPVIRMKQIPMDNITAAGETTYIHTYKDLEIKKVVTEYRKSKTLTDMLEKYPEEAFEKHLGASPSSNKMTKAEYKKYHAEMCEKMKQITEKKNHDYTGGSDDPFANFKYVESLGITSTEVGMLTRMTDKMSRINSFIKKGSYEVEDESITDTLLDLANYSILLAGYIKSKG